MDIVVFPVPIKPIKATLQSIFPLSEAFKRNLTISHGGCPGADALTPAPNVTTDPVILVQILVTAPSSPIDIVIIGAFNSLLAFFEAFINVLTSTFSLGITAILQISAPASSIVFNTLNISFSDGVPSK